jgi:hypothetical protein
MLTTEYRPLSYKDHLDGCKKFLRLAEFVEKFVPANKLLVKDHKDKLARGKKTQRWKVSREFE